MSKKIESKTVQFEAQLEALESIVERMEQGDLSLEDSIKEFEQGMKLASQCQNALEQAELKVKALLSEESDDLTDFDSTDPSAN